MTKFFNWFRVLAALNSLNQRLATQENSMATFQEDVTRLTADVAAQKTTIDQVSALVATDTATIADLKTQLAALQGQTNPDLSALEAGLTALETNNAALSAVLPPAPAPTGPSTPAA